MVNKSKSFSHMELKKNNWSSEKINREDIYVTFKVVSENSLGEREDREDSQDFDTKERKRK